jgi:periplasmic divalent cation tolerance protein
MTLRPGEPMLVGVSATQSLAVTSDLLIVMTTCAAADADRLAARLVGERMAACVNSVPHLSSTYVWNGKIEHADECLLLIKTTRARFPALERAINEYSAYELPEIIAVAVDSGSAAYCAWVEASVTTQESLES